MPKQAAPPTAGRAFPITTGPGVFRPLKTSESVARDIVDSAIATDADIVALSVLYVEDRRRVIDEITAIRSKLPMGIPLFVGGSGGLALKRDLSTPGIYVSGNVAEVYDEARRTVGS